MRLPLHIFLLLLYPHPILTALTLRYTLSLLPLPPSPSSPPTTTYQQCTRLPPNHCCIPIDISETPHDRHRLRYIPQNLDFRAESSRAEVVDVWAGTGSAECRGRPVARVEVGARRGWQGWGVGSGVRVMGVGVEGGGAGVGGRGNGTASVAFPASAGTGEDMDGDAVGVQAGEEKEVTYPDEVMYRGGLYRRYMKDRSEYVLISHWGEGPGTIYGFKQGVRGGLEGDGGVDVS